MPPFSAIALDRLLETGASKPIDKPVPTSMPVPISRTFDRTASAPAMKKKVPPRPPLKPTLYTTPEVKLLPIATSPFNRNILEIDTERMIARVEPLVNMGQITRLTVPMNLSLVVVAELDDLTVGGLINGYGIEGSSHKYGPFLDTVVAFEIISADGSLVKATKDNEYSDLFYATPWSQGTLGLLVAAEVKLIPIKEYMKLTYKPVVGNLKDIAQAYSDSFAPRDGDQDNDEKVPDFVETMIYSPTRAVCMTGRYASKEEAKTSMGRRCWYSGLV